MAGPLHRDGCEVAASDLTVLLVHVAAATSASCRDTSQQNIAFQMFLQFQTLRRRLFRGGRIRFSWTRRFLLRKRLPLSVLPVVLSTALRVAQLRWRRFSMAQRVTPNSFAWTRSIAVFLNRGWSLRRRKGLLCCPVRWTLGCSLRHCN